MSDRDRSVGDLLGLAIARPDDAEAWAQRIVASETDPWVLSVARHALGVVWRDRGQLDRAVPELRTAVTLARRSGDPERECDVRAALGLSLAIAGRTHAGLSQLQQALDAASDPVTIAKIRMRRGHAFYFLLLRPREALADLELALATFRSVDERIWMARTLNVVGLSQVALGRADLAAQAINEAEEIFMEEGQVAESVVTLHNRGYIAWCRGDLPAALRLYDEAAEGYAALGEDYSLLVYDRCQAFLAAGLVPEAVELVARRIGKGSLEAVHEAELLLTLSSAELVDGHIESADAHATRAHEMFRRQRRDWWAAQAELAILLVRHQKGTGGRRLANAAASVGDRLATIGMDEAASAWLLAGQVAASARLGSAARCLKLAAEYRSRPSGLVSSTGWQALALERDLQGDARGVLNACRRGLEALDRHRATLGSSELRALATRHGDELAALALRHAMPGRPRGLLEWAELWRANALFQSPVHPPDDEVLAGDLAALRATRRRLTEARSEGSANVTRLADDQVRLERAIRRRTHHLAGTSAGTTRFRASQLIDSLGDITFVELVNVDEVLHALVARQGRIRHLALGAAAEADQAVAFARFAIRQAARGRPTDMSDVGRRLQAALLGEVAGHLADGPVVLSPTSRLHTAPWGLLPVLADVPVTVTPSAALWLRARTATPRDGRVLIAGPGLESGGAEIPVLAERHPDAVVLRDGSATAERCLAALDGAGIAHIAAHGRFREDSPMFSSLELDDGPITVHDLERLGRAPYRVVLSACESGVVAPIGAGEMLGLAAAMLSMGTAGIVSSVAKVNDAATAVVMLQAHRAIDEGADLGTVMLQARQAARGDSIQEATAAAFIAIGA